ncbi:MAG: C-terminal binding protein [Ruminococcaceae bacterium]|nr:C-terminal binding protein [Oscillospiraceae bacterium]
MKKTLVLAKETPIYRSELAAHGIETVFCDSKDPDEIAAAGMGCAAAIFTSVRFDETQFSKMPDLKLLSRYGIGIDTVDLSAATAHGVTVCNCPTYGTYDVAEHTVALILALSRSIPQYDRRIKSENNWRQAGMRTAHRLSVQRLGVVGFGRIARWVVTMLRGFGMETMVYDPYLNEESAKELGVRSVTLEELVAQADIITLNAPLTKETHHMVNEALIAKMKPGVLLVNTSRGGLVDEAALVKALQSGHIAGAALDVFEKEPFAEDHPLRSMENVILTPHVAWCSVEAKANLQTEVLGNVIDYFEGRPLKNALN